MEVAPFWGGGGFFPWRLILRQPAHMGHYHSTMPARNPGGLSNVRTHVLIDDMQCEELNRETADPSGEGEEYSRDTFSARRHRRHMSKSQMGAVAVEYEKWLAVEAERRKSENGKVRAHLNNGGRVQEVEKLPPPVKAKPPMKPALCSVYPDAPSATPNTSPRLGFSGRL